jgi:prepilin-type N-terminal cleavage/methylation domain-containing protein
MKPQRTCAEGFALIQINAKTKGFTLIELVVVIALLGLLYTLAAPSLLSSFEKARGKHCGGNLLLLENAKDAFVLDHPSQPMTSPAQLLPYLKNGIPQCPSGGTYLNLTDTFTRCSCSLDQHGGSGQNDGVHDSGL